MSDGDLQIYNYCLAFIDLLGQGDALRNQGLIPVFKTDDERKAFEATIKESVGAIRRLQKLASDLKSAADEYTQSSPIRAGLPPEQQAVLDQMNRTNVIRQCWSDGLVYYSNIGDQDVKCRVNGIYDLIVLSGALHFYGLASKQPVRGGVDIAWGVELAPGEIYGAAVARSYELESAVAQYPRIVVSDRIVDFLGAAALGSEGDVFEQCDAGLAQLCLRMLLKDVDGVWMVHILGDAYRQAITQDQHESLYGRALSFIHSQLELHRSTKNTKLAMRYCMLLDYFEHHKP